MEDLQTAEKDRSLPIVLHAAVTELLDMVMALASILNPAEASDAMAEKVDRIMSSREGSRFLMKTALMQQPFFKAEATSFARFRAAALEVAPEMAEVRSNLPTCNSTSLASAFARIPAWSDATRAGGGAGF